jgi:hypothetical protein
MKFQGIPYARLLRQRIAGEGLQTTADVVRWMGAVQAQDFAAGKWAVGLRSSACTDANVEAAFAAGTILRTHVMRPTWHFVAADDIRWMQALTAPRVEKILAYQHKQLELDASVLRRSCKLLENALRGGRQLSRDELGAVLRQGGIPNSGLRMGNIMAHAELASLVCSGARRGKQFTYALVEERAPQARSLPHDEALALLTRRYFTSHGPATLRDFAWWSGLLNTEVRAGLELVRSELISETIDGEPYWMNASPPLPRHTRIAIHLLDNYDEYMVGYAGRSAITHEVHEAGLDPRRDSPLNRAVVSRGRLQGTWKRETGKHGLGLEVRLFSAPTGAMLRGLGQAAKRLAKFLDLPIADLKVHSDS